MEDLLWALDAQLYILIMFFLLPIWIDKATEPKVKDKEDDNNSI